jgi:membrane glycosyltransferase
MITHTKHADLCASLEQWSQDDLNFLSEFGASSLSTPQLYHLRVTLIDKLVMSQRRFNFLFLILLCSIGWAIFGTGLMVIGLEMLAYPIFALFIACMALASVGLFLINKTTSTGRLNHYLNLVQTELANRQELVLAFES